MRITVKFRYLRYSYLYEFDYRLNFIIGDSAIGKSFISHMSDGEVTIEGHDVPTYRYFTGTPPVNILQSDIASCNQLSLAVLDETYVSTLKKNGLLHTMFRAPCNFVIISRDVNLLGTVPTSPQQYYSLFKDSNGNTHTVPQFPHWKINNDRHYYVSEDSRSGNIIWSKVLDALVKASPSGNAGAVKCLAKDPHLMGCIDTLSFAGSMQIFEYFYDKRDVPLFDVPSVEYLILQALMPAEEIDSIIYASPNPEKKCEELLRKLAPQYTKSKTDTLPCPTDCPECEILKCPGAGQDVLSAIRVYLKNLHPEYNFPWEVEQHTNKFN